jgi:hypothetical protein
MAVKAVAAACAACGVAMVPSVAAAACPEMAAIPTFLSGTSRTDLFWMGGQTMYDAFVDGYGSWQGGNGVDLDPACVPLTAASGVILFPTGTGSIGEDTPDYYDFNQTVEVSFSTLPNPPNTSFPATAPVSSVYFNSSTYAFAVDIHGSIWEWHTSGGSWTSPIRWGNAGLAAQGAHVGAGVQNGSQITLAVVDSVGNFDIVTSSNTYEIYVNGFNPLAFVAMANRGSNELDAFVVDKNGNLDIFYVDGWNSWKLAGPSFSGFSAGAPVGAYSTSSNTWAALPTPGGQLSLIGYNNGWVRSNYSSIAISTNTAPTFSSQIKQTDLFVITNSGPWVYVPTGPSSVNGPFGPLP